jgi:hypothetical protein
MGASSGWNLVARRSPRGRASKNGPARHLVSVPREERPDGGSPERPGASGEQPAAPQRPTASQ